MIDYLTLVLMTSYHYSFCFPLFTVSLTYLLQSIRLAVPHPRILSSGFPLLNRILIWQRHAQTHVLFAATFISLPQPPLLQLP